MPVSIPKCTIGIKDSNSELEKEEFLRKDLLSGMILSHFFSTGGDFYQELYKADLIDDSFYFETNLERNFGYSMIGGNTAKPEEFAAKIKEQLLSTKNYALTVEVFERMKKKKIGQLLRAMNSLEFIANKYIQYHTMGINLFEIIPAIQALSLDDAQAFLNEWIAEERLAVCTISAS